MREHESVNQAGWNRWAAEYVDAGRRAWALPPGQEDRGLRCAPQSQLRLLREWARRWKAEEASPST